jgi:hypothetical protein
VAVRSETLSLKQVTDRVNLIHEVLNKVMVKGTHYGTVPGCGAKNVLLKPGADLLAMVFRLVPQFKVNQTNLENGHREFDVTCSMFNPAGELLGQGVGSASTMEKKYRYRKDAAGNKVENEDIADVYNTVLKIAKKRAHIDATLTVTGAADIFTQDLIDDDDGEKPPIKPPQAKAPAAEAPPPPPPEANRPAGENEIALVTLGEVKSKAGSTPKGPWLRTFSKASDGRFYSTFDKTLGDVMSSLEGQDVAIRYVVKQGPKGESYDVITIEPAAAEEAKPESKGNLPF